MLDKTYRKHITNSKLLNESTKKIYLSKLDVIQYDIWKNCKTTQKIGKGKCLHYIINHPEAFIEKMDEYVNKTKGRLDDKLSIHAPDSFVSVIGALFRHTPGMMQKHAELYKKWMKNADGESQADIINLYKAWEADIGKLSKSGIPDVERLWADYETFVSNGMLMFGTKAGKAMTGGIERVGMAINQVDPDRQASNLFNTLCCLSNIKV